MSTWAKVELSEQENQAVEQYQQENDCSKPEAIKRLVRGHAKHLMLIDDE